MSRSERMAVAMMRAAVADALVAELQALLDTVVAAQNEEASSATPKLGRVEAFGVVADLLRERGRAVRR